MNKRIGTDDENKNGIEQIEENTTQIHRSFFALINKIASQQRHTKRRYHFCQSNQTK